MRVGKTSRLRVIFEVGVYAAIALWSSGSMADPEGSHDYPAFGRVAGYYILNYSERHFDQHVFSAGNQQMRVQGHTIYIQYYNNNTNRPSAYELSLNFQEMLKKVSAETLSDENAREDNERLVVRFMQNGKHVYCDIHSYDGGSNYEMFFVEEGTFQPSIEPPK